MQLYDLYELGDKSNPETQKHCCIGKKLGQFRKNHPSVGAEFTPISSTVYFSRTFSKGDYMDKVVVALDLKLEQRNFSENYFSQTAY
jgi:alpha-amylase